MAGSTASLDSLSSPSPSPPPPEDTKDRHSNTGVAGLDTDSELSELTEEEQEKEEDVSGRSRKRQRDRIVPAPMWEWAYKQRKSKEKPDWRSKMIAEEEEEEQAGPARAMEEEEEDDQGPDTNPIDDLPTKDAALSDDDNVGEDEKDDGDAPDEELDSADEALPPRRDGGADDDLSEVENDGDDDFDDVGAGAQQPPATAGSPDLTEDENEDVEEEELDDDSPPTKEVSDAEDDDDYAPGGADAPDADGLPVMTAAEDAVEAGDGEADADLTMDVDVAVPVLASPVAVAHSSIMAGSTLIRPPSPSSSQPSTPSASRDPSRSPSAEPEAEQDIQSEQEPEPEPERKAAGFRGRVRKGRARTRGARRRVTSTADVNLDGEDADQAEGMDGDGPDAEDGDAATPELELDADMQPAHRAEALDELAKIELKFALLRERLYVEKMDTLAWEENLIIEGVHPELIHLHAELSKRRDKRIELASRRRDYEVANVTKRRKLDEDGVWSWWKDARDELQTHMITEYSSKRRRLERERRAVERPQPVRRLPAPPSHIPQPLTLLEIIKASPYGHADTSIGSRKKPGTSTAYPQLDPLSPLEVMRDLETLYQQRRVALDPHRPGLMNAVLGSGPHHLDPYTAAMGMQMMDGPYAQPGLVPAQMGGPAFIQSFGHPPGRSVHHHLGQPGALPQHLTHTSMAMDHDVQMGMRPPSGIPPQPVQHQQQFGGAGPGPSTMMMRSNSPVSLSNGAFGPPNGFSATGPKPNGWTSGPSSKDSKRVNGELDARDRERDRERHPERERVARTEREFDRDREEERAHHTHGQPRHTHQHVHPHPPNQAQPPHHHGAHPHTHHHHHVHHHHHPPHSNSHGPPIPHNGGAPTSRARSPHTSRDLDQRRPHPGPPMELIELSAPATKPPLSSPRATGSWKSPNEQSPPTDSSRGRVAPQGEPQERIPMTMAPSQSHLPGSPRSAPSQATGPPSSRRGSWVAAERSPHHPALSSMPPSGSGTPAGQRPPLSSRGAAPSSSTAPFHGPFSSPPLTNGRTLPPPVSPSGAPPFTSPLRSPTRVVQAKPRSPPHPSLPPSPKPLKMGGFANGEAGNMQIASLSSPLNGGLPTTSPLALYPSNGPSRLATGALVEKAVPPGAVPKAVPVDGS